MRIDEYKSTLAVFDPEAEGYSKQNAVFLGEAAQAAYGSADASDPDGMRAWAGRVGFAECVPFGGYSGVAKGQVEGFVAKTETLLLVSFRGTDPTLSDWLIDFDTLPVRDSVIPGEVHKGFNDALLAVWSQVRPHLDDRGNRRVWLTGHSLGGALAVACAARATFEVPRVGIRGIYTYGQPRYGNETCAKACAEVLGSGLFRHINNRDIVPRVPPFLMGFRHWGTEVLFDQSGHPHVNGSDVEHALDLAWQFVADPLDLSPLRNLFTGRDERAALEKLKTESFEVATDHFMGNAYLPVLWREAGY